MFPLPELVLFPSATIPLHVFELRYRTMVRDTLSRDRVIALATLKPGYELDYHGSPEFHELACLARFEDVAWLPNDRYDLTVQGVTRVLLRDTVSEFPYRSVRVEPLPQHPYAEDDPIVLLEKAALLQAFERLVRVLAERSGEPTGAGLPALDAECSYERVVNVLAMTCGAPAAERLELLAEDSVLERGRRVREILERGLSPARRASEPPPAAGEHN